MTFNRRQFFKGAGALIALTAVPEIVQTAVAQTNAPTVSESDATQLFSQRVHDRVGALINHMNNYDGNIALSNLFNSAQTDQQRALIVAFKAMGGVELSDAAGNEVINKYVYYEGDNQVWTVHTVALNKVIADYANRKYSDGTTIIADVTKSANALLKGANNHRMNFPDYMSKVYLTHNFTNNAGGIAMQKAAKSFGLGGNSPVTIASLNREPIH